MGDAFAQIADKVSPAVVGIKAETKVAQGPSGLREWPIDPFGDDFFDYFFRRQRPRQRSPRYRKQVSQGSGFIISPDGYILTNNHLVGKTEEIMVKLADDKEFEARLIGADPDSDVAVIKIEAEGLKCLELADSDKLKVGEWVIAIGNPFGFSHTVTAGIVSAKGRSGVGLAAYEDFIQTDAAINPGNSGGPLLNLDGEVVGINTAIISRSGGNMGIGLAIPVNMAKGIYEQLIESGTVTRGFLGVNIQDLTADLAESLGLERETKGVIIPQVSKDSAAEKAGVEKGDIVVELNGQKVEDKDVFRNQIAMLKPGTKVELVVLRDGKRKSLTVELGQKPQDQQAAAAGGAEAEKTLGIGVTNLSDKLAERLGFEGLSGVVVESVEPDSLAAEKGIAAGMLIMEVNRKPVKNTKKFDKAVKQAVKGGKVLLLVNNGTYSQYVLLKLPED
jgi:serine protease Do